MRTLFFIQMLATLTMTGLIWFVQVVHYPLFARIPPTTFVRYEAEHATRTGWVAGPLMCAEFATAMLMLSSRFRPQSIPTAAALAGAALMAVIWLSTGLIQVPLHSRLSAGYDAHLIATLVATNWIRTLTWTARSALLLTWVAKLIRQ